MWCVHCVYDVCMWWHAHIVAVCVCAFVREGVCSRATGSLLSFSCCKFTEGLFKTIVAMDSVLK